MLWSTLIGLFVLIGSPAAAQDQGKPDTISTPGDGPDGPKTLEPGGPLIGEASDTATASIAVVPTAIETSTASTLGGTPQLTAPPDPAWDAYHEAALDLARGALTQARSRLVVLIADFGDHPAAFRGRKLLEAMDGEGFAQQDPEPPPDVFDGPERPTALARAELVAGQTISGFGLGLEFCGLIDCGDARAWVGSVLGFGAAGALGSLVLSRSGVTPGRATLLNSATAWGLANGFALLGATTPNNFAAGGFATLMVTQLAGLGVGELIYRFTEPTSGDVSMVNSVALWSLAATATIHGIAQTGNSRVVFTSLLIIGDAALIGGAFLAQAYPMSRGRTLLIDLSGILGTLVGAGVVLVAAGNDVTGTGVAVGALGGMLVGLGGGAYLTRNWDKPDDESSVSAQLNLQPVEGGAILGLGGRF